MPAVKLLSLLIKLNVVKKVFKAIYGQFLTLVAKQAQYVSMRYKLLIVLGFLLTSCSQGFSATYSQDGFVQVAGGQAPYTYEAGEDSQIDVDPVNGKITPKSAKVKAVSAGMRHTCAIDEYSALWCWGNNAFGASGTASKTMELSPVRLGSGSRKYSAVAVAANGTCAAAVNEVWCWGYVNSWHSLLRPGIELDVSSLLEYKLADLPANVKQIVGGYDHMCALLHDGSVWCWGGNISGAVTGVLPDNVAYDTPVMLDSLKNIDTIAASEYRTCAAGERLYCWGWDFVIGPDIDKSKSVQEAMIRLSMWTKLVYSDPEVATPAFKEALILYATMRDYALPGRVDTIVLGGTRTCVTSSGKIYCKGINVFEPTNPIIYASELVPLTSARAFSEVFGAGNILCYTGESTQCSGNLESITVAGIETNARTLVEPSSNSWKILRIVSWFDVENRICGVDEYDDLYCWGSVKDTVSGDGTANMYASPVRVHLRDNTDLDEGTYTIVVTDAVGRATTLTFER